MISGKVNCFTDYAADFDSVDHLKLWKILQEMGISHHPASWEICMQVRKQICMQVQLELDMEQQTVPNRKRSTSSLYIVTLLI